MTTQTLTRPQPARKPARHDAPERHLPQGTEVRGFALYVGLAEAKLDTSDPQLGAIVEQIKHLVAQLAPAADTYAAVALALEAVGGRDVDVVRLALGAPAARSRVKQQVDEDQDRARSGITIDLSRKTVLLDNIPAQLTYREFELLQALVLREGRTVSREELIEAQWSAGGTDDAPNSRTIDVHVRRLRVKLAHYQSIIRTVRGNGYRFDRHADVAILHGSAPSPDVI